MMTTTAETLLDQWAEWLATSASRRLTPATISEYRRAVRFFAAWLSASFGLLLTAEQLTPYRLHLYIQSLERQVQRQERQPATYNKTVAALSSLGQWLVATNQSTTNPAQGLRTIIEQPAPINALEPAIIRKLLDAAHHTDDLRDTLVVELLAHSGMRASEVAQLHLEQLEVGPRITWVVLAGKTQHARCIPLPTHVGKLIQRYLTQRERGEGCRPSAGPLLVGERGGLTRSTINRIVARVAARSELTPAERERVTPHAFRQSVATQLVRKRDLVVAAEILGHQSLATTRRYRIAATQEVESALMNLYVDD